MFERFRPPYSSAPAQHLARLVCPSPTLLFTAISFFFVTSFLLSFIPSFFRSSRYERSIVLREDSPLLPSLLPFFLSSFHPSFLSSFLSNLSGDVEARSGFRFLVVTNHLGFGVESVIIFLMAGEKKRQTHPGGVSGAVDHHQLPDSPRSLPTQD